jgi:uncharacterized sporulation protein YeaH/YhbH (DUF444 family)
MHIIDRRPNPKGKSLANRQKFLRRARRQIREAVRGASSGRRVADIADGDKVTIPADSLREPSFRKSATGGARHRVLPGNRDYVEGDRIPRPPTGGGGGGREGSPDGEGEDAFRFMLSREEFLDIFLDDLELPDLLKKDVKHAESTEPRRAGYSVTGSPSNLNLVRTMRNSLSRRIALGRPKAEDLAELEAEIAELEVAAERDGEDHGDRLVALREELERKTRRLQLIPYLDPVDVRFNRYEQVPQPVTQAVMFCLMDVSGSMNEEMKDLAKRFFMLLYLFIERRYRNVDIVFVRHTHRAEEVDEDTFFYSPETGGTIVSTALEEMLRVVGERYPVGDWNIYAAQASDGDNVSGDNARVVELLSERVLPLTQFFAYIEIARGPRAGNRNDSSLWQAYTPLAQLDLPFAMRRVADRGDIYPVFRELFSREKSAA